MPLVIIASQNPVKIQAIRRSFEQMFPRQAHTFKFKGIAVPSGVSDQPMTRDETMRGTQNRVFNAAMKIRNATYYASIESGIFERGGNWFAFAYVCIRNKKGVVGISGTADFQLPAEIIRLVLEKKIELGKADDIVFGQTNSKEQMGAAGLLTTGVITRTDLFVQAGCFALAPFKNPKLYPVAG